MYPNILTTTNNYLLVSDGKAVNILTTTNNYLLVSDGKAVNILTTTNNQKKTIISEENNNFIRISYT